VLFTMMDDCPHDCGRRHNGHGAASAERDPDGTYGARVPHCGDHTHERTAEGRRRRVNDLNACRISHPNYVLVPASIVEPEA